ncbi:MAG: O-antigen ligase family protein [Acidaminococcaceae bacterium]|nr:O-antigen ligase family protein [Acidaminococcaceae bacterium]
MTLRLNHLTIKGLAILLIVYSNICFYKLDTQAVFLILNVIAGVITVASHSLRKVKLTIPVAWLTCIFLMFIISGTFRLQAGTFNWDRYVISYFQCILFYILIKDIVADLEYEKVLAYTFGLAAILCILTMYIQEGGFFGRELRSVGSTLSGNVNTVGMSFGILSLFMVYYYGKSRKILVFLVSIAVMAIMMLTGSKKTIVYIIANVFILYSFSKNKTKGKIVLISLFSVVAYLVFGVDYYYELLGSRIIDMLGQLGFPMNNAHYSYSTEIRIYMIGEAFQMWLQHPLFGGGTNYFQAQTATRYEYSHCNVTELLCSLGIIGCALYYLPHITFIKRLKKIVKEEPEAAHFSIILIVVTLAIDWMAVTYSSFSTMYIPIIFVLIMMEKHYRMGFY